jgi:hypothetical protein
MGVPAEPPADGESKRRSIDAEWDAMFEASAVPRAPADAPPESSSPEASFAGPRVAESSSADMPMGALDLDAVDPDERVATPSPVVGEQAMVSGSWAMAIRDGSPSSAMPAAPPSASASTSSGRMRDTDAEMAALMGARRRGDAQASPARPEAPRGGGEAPRDGGEAPRGGGEAPRGGGEAPRDGGASVEPPMRESTDALVTVAAPASHERAATSPREGTSTPASGRPKTGPLARAPGSAARRMASGEPRRITARSPSLDLGERPRRLSLWWAVVAGVGIAGVAWLVGAPWRTNNTAATVATNTPSTAPIPDPKPSTPSSGQSALASSSTTAADPQPPVEATPRVPAPAEAVDPPPVAPTPVPTRESLDPPTKPPVTPPVAGNGVRTPPPGTPPDIAATFVRLPVSPADRAPVGGVGSSGIHIDRIDMGAGYDNKTGCTGVAREFSLAANQEINVCVRVVHPREEETMSIVWQKDDGTTARRGKIAVKPIHAYRTRAYLRLRAEYVGKWTVRIMSPDGVELASHAFVISP